MLIMAIYSCKKDVIDMDKKSDIWEIEKELAMPLVKGHLLLSDLTDEANDESNASEYLVIDGDTVKLHVIRDSLFSFKTSDLVIIPSQNTFQYIIRDPDSDIDVSVQPETFTPFQLITDTVFELTLQNKMRLDSMYLNSGQLLITADNSYNYDVVLNLHSDSIVDPLTNSPFSRNITIGQDNNVLNYPIDLSGYKIIFGHTSDSVTTVKMIITPSFNKSSGSGNLLSSEMITLNIDVSDLNDFDIVYGFMGYQGSTYDTISDIIVKGMEEELRHVSGTFQATNPKIRLNYEQSFGVPLGADLLVNTYRNNVIDGIVDMEPKIIPALANPTDPELKGSILFSNVDNIDELFKFPLADSVQVVGDVSTNPGMNPVTTNNFVNRNSEMLLGLDIELPLEFRSDLTYCDTLDNPLFDDSGDALGYDFEYLDLYSRFKNTFPISFDITLVLFDSVRQEVVDSIDLNSNSDEPYISAAPVDANGIVITSQVTEKISVTELNTEKANNLLMKADHLILKAKIRTYEATSVKVLQTSRIDFQIALNAKGKMVRKL